MTGNIVLIDINHFEMNQISTLIWPQGLAEMQFGQAY